MNYELLIQSYAIMNRYGRGEYIPEKAKWGFGGTITMPCVRVYHTDPSYSLDLYWYKRISADETEHPKTDTPLFFPPDYVPKRDGALICNYEGYTGELPGGCRLESDMFPLKPVVMYNRQFPVPANSPKVLKEMYGDDWETPRPKGYKALLCPPIWTGNGNNFYLMLLLIGLSGVIGIFWFLRARYIQSLEHARYSPVPASEGHTSRHVERATCHCRCCGDDGCLARGLIRLFVLTGAPASSSGSSSAGVGARKSPHTVTLHN
jgi:hypothetical protein